MEGPGLGKGGPKIHWELTARKYFVFVCIQVMKLLYHMFLFHFYHNNKDTVTQNSNRPTVL